MHRPFVLFYFHFVHNLSLFYLFVLYHSAILCAALHLLVYWCLFNCLYKSVATQETWFTSIKPNHYGKWGFRACTENLAIYWLWISTFRKQSSEGTNLDVSGLKERKQSKEHANYFLVYWPQYDIKALCFGCCIIDNRLVYDQMNDGNNHLIYWHLNALCIV